MSALLQLLVVQTGLLESDVQRIAQNAPRRYKVYEIPKRSGGMRTIAQPARELKFLQRAIVDRVFLDLPVHEAAFAYRHGLSIKDNALRHAGDGPILKMDFADFFPSIKAEDWANYCRGRELLSPEDIELSARILFRRAKGDHFMKLAIGAPSSPALSNILMFEFDQLVAAEASKRGIIYTRYADDMTFSGQRIGMLKDMVKVVHAVTKQMKSPRLTVNGDKTIFVTTKNKRSVTGLTLTNDGKISVGRDRKRALFAQIHHALQGKLNEQEIKELVGRLAFVHSVEPAFMVRLAEKYGADEMARIKRLARY